MRHSRLPVWPTWNRHACRARRMYRRSGSRPFQKCAGIAHSAPSTPFSARKGTEKREERPPPRRESRSGPKTARDVGEYPVIHSKQHPIATPYEEPGPCPSKNETIAKLKSGLRQHTRREHGHQQTDPPPRSRMPFSGLTSPPAEPPWRYRRQPTVKIAKARPKGHNERNQPPRAP